MNCNRRKIKGEEKRICRSITLGIEPKIKGTWHGIKVCTACYKELNLEQRLEIQRSKGKTIRRRLEKEYEIRKRN